MSEEQLGSIESVSMDMWPANVKSTLEHVPWPEHKIAFDRFHVTKKINGGVDKVRGGRTRSLPGKA